MPFGIASVSSSNKPSFMFNSIRFFPAKSNRMKNPFPKVSILILLLNGLGKTLNDEACIIDFE